MVSCDSVKEVASFDEFVESNVLDIETVAPAAEHEVVALQ
jgi:hypothetical protein